MTLRRAESADAKAVAALWNDMIEHSSATFTTALKSPEEVAQMISGRGAGFIVAEQQGALMGFVTYGAFRAGPGYAHTMEHSIVLAEPARGSGLGRRLMQDLEAVAKGQSVHSMIGCVSGENTGAIAFHQKLGFTQAGRLREAGFKFGRWMDLVLMQKHL